MKARAGMWNWLDPGEWQPSECAEEQTLPDQVRKLKECSATGNIRVVALPRMPPLQEYNQ